MKRKVLVCVTVVVMLLSITLSTTLAGVSGGFDGSDNGRPSYICYAYGYGSAGIYAASDVEIMIKLYNTINHLKTYRLATDFEKVSATTSMVNNVNPYERLSLNQI